MPSIGDVPALRAQSFADPDDCADLSLTTTPDRDDSDLDDSELGGSDLDESDLDESDLDVSDLDVSDLDGSDLDGSDLDVSELEGSDPDGSELDGSGQDEPEQPAEPGAASEDEDPDADLENWPEHDPGADDPHPARTAVDAREQRLPGLGDLNPLLFLLLPIALAVCLTISAHVVVAQRSSDVRADLAAARSASARIAEHLAQADTAKLTADLTDLDRYATRADARSTGFAWAVARVGRGEVRRLQDQARDSASLAPAAATLGRSLGPLSLHPSVQAPAIKTKANTKTKTPDPRLALDDLDRLARAVTTLATAATRVGDPAAPALTRAALVTSLLPELAGSHQPRRWTFCRTARGPCTALNARNGVLTGAAPVGVPLRATSTTIPTDPVDPTNITGRDDPTLSVDILVVGMDAGDAVGPTGQLARMAFDVLYTVDRRSTARPRISVHSRVAAEQAAIERLAEREV